ncbi:MAG: hypothetical protein ACREMW_12685 [Gemmatimonadales bacterium]
MLLKSLWTRLVAVLRGRRRAAPTAQLPRWSQVRRRRRADIRRVAALVEGWAEEMGVSKGERGRWLALPRRQPRAGPQRPPQRRARLAKRVPRDRDAVLREVVARQMQEQLRSGRSIDPLTLEFWNSLAGR